MNKELFETQWQQVKDAIRDKWGNLTEDEIRQINGRYDQLIAKLQQRYGYTREEAEEELRNWNWKYDRNAKTNLGYGTERSSVRTRSEREDDSWRNRNAETPSIGKWLLLAALPLLLLAGYLGTRDYSTVNQDNTFTPARTTTTTQDTFTRGTASDQLISQDVRNALLADPTIANDARSIRIDTNNGVVTISGFVSTSSEKQLVTRLLQNVSGIRQVNNQLEVRQ
jgi:uncharacterized protein YjbJ (UPF0337 family)